MKKLFIIFLVFLSGLLLSPNAQASHFAGSGITYTCLGGNTYLITMSFYRDCSGVSAPSSVTVTFSCSTNSQLNFNATLNKIPGTGQVITPNCAAIPSKCNNGNNYGIREYIYQAQVTLQACNSWNISYSSCCRNPISTLQSSGGWYVMAQLNNLQAPSNSSPFFTNLPIAIACNGQTTVYNPGAIDPNGDSLAYSFFAPKTSASAIVNYNGGYSYTNFLTSSTPITIDSHTGDISFTPTMNLITITGIKVEEWRSINGIPTLVGTIYRDIQLKVDYCNNNIPVLSGMDTLHTHSYTPNDSTYAIEMCIGDWVDFDINGFDADSFNASNTGHPERIHITWNQGIPQGTFTSYHNGTDSAYAHFSWYPTPADVSNLPKCFTATIHDEACPYYGSQTYSYCFTVRGMIVDIGSDTLLCTGDTLTVFANADSTTVNYMWKWNGQATSTPLTSDNYFINTANYAPGIDTLSIETNDGNTTLTCPGMDYIIINHTYQPHIHGALPDTVKCGFEPAIFDAGPGSRYLWKKLPNNPIGNKQTIGIDTTGTYMVIVDGGVNTRCRDADTFIVEALIPPPPFNLGNDTTISPTNTLTLSLPSGYAAYQWNTGDTTSSIIIDNSYLWQNKIIGSIIAQNQCKSSDTIMVYIGSVGMGDNQESDNEVKIYPNPVKASLTIYFPKAVGKSEVSVFDISGKLMLQETFSGESYKMNSVRNLAAGSYFLRIKNIAGVQRLSFVKE